MTTAHLIDGTFELFRSYFGAPPAKSRTGIEIGATIGLTRSLVSWLRTGAVTHAGIAFDHVIESFRNDLFPGYKTGEGLDPELYAQFPMAEDAARALGLVVWPMTTFEADDALASAAAQCDAALGIDHVVIASPDKDLCQCVRGTKVVAWDRMRGNTLNADGVVAKFGVPPAVIPDWLALVGDTADGIPGITGWGAKSAATLLAAYGSIEAIPEDPAAWTVAVRSRDRLAAALNADRDAAMLYRTLATLRLDVPIVATEQTLRWGGLDAQALAAFWASIGARGAPPAVAGT